MGAADESIGVIETELLTLVRHLETLGRKGSLYVRIDRSGYLVLRTLERTGPVPITSLAQTLQLDGSTVTRQVTALVAGGFVERRPNPADGRSSIVAVTPDGRREMREVERHRRRILQEMFSSWDESERQAVGEALRRLNGSLVERVAVLRRAASDAGRGAEED